MKEELKNNPQEALPQLFSRNVAHQNYARNVMT